MTENEILPPESTPARHSIALPLARPRITFVLLGLIVLVFVLETVLGGSTRTIVLVTLGAQVNALVAAGQIWRLLTAMFLHIGFAHIAFNGWALFSLGRDVEAFYGSIRFAVIYFLAGLFGGLAYYLLGAFTGAFAPSAGASGAIFGLIGAEIAFFLRNRTLFGSLGQQRLGNLAVLVLINLVFGATTPGINNLAHVGGLLSGLLLGVTLAPHYEVVWQWAGLNPAPRLVNRTPVWAQTLAVGAAILLFVAGLSLGGQRWY